MKMRAVSLMLLVVCAISVQGASRQMSVQVRETAVREKPSFLGRPVGMVSYGDRVQQLQEEGAWSRVSGYGINGWLHTSALTRKKLDKQAGSADLSATASSEELALAGKGFSAEVEAEYKAQNADIDFAPVDRMEAIVISEPEMHDFLLEGDVVPREGGRK